MSRNLNDLHPDLQPIAQEFQRRALARGINFTFTCTFRTGAEQDALYAQGRTAPGQIVTRAKAGQSSHNFLLSGQPASKAFDVVPTRDGKAVWGVTGADLALWQGLGQIGIELGLKWYGAPDAPFREFPHFELRK